MRNGTRILVFTPKFVVVTKVALPAHPFVNNFLIV